MHYAVLVVGENPFEELEPFDEQECHTFIKRYTQKEMLADYGQYLQDHPEGKEEYPDVNAYAKDYYGYHKNGKHWGYLSNPEGRWDWWEIGGRWTGYFKLKDGKRGVTGEPGIGTKPNEDPTCADQALKGDIDFDTMRREESERAGARWDRANEVIGTVRRLHATWEEILHFCPDTDTARKVYHSQITLFALRGAGFFSWDFDALFVSREEYVQRAIKHTGVPYALVKDGEWFQGNDGDAWADEFQSLMASVSDDELLTLADCHN